MNRHGKKFLIIVNTQKKILEMYASALVKVKQKG